jgi:hypothetical protein
MSWTKDDLTVVYHVAGMGNWKEVVNEQLALLQRVGLTSVQSTYVGPEPQWLESCAKEHSIDLHLVKQSPNTDHYETFAMLHIEELAKSSDKPVLYFHTKGVSNPGDHRKPIWRRLMGRWVVERWKENLDLLATHETVGVDWLHCTHSHYVGNFWLARADYLRRQEPFVTFHTNMSMTRFSCEFWIGWGNPKNHSHVCRNLMWWDLVDKYGYC